MDTWGTSGQPVRDFTLYSGTLGTAFLLFKAYEVTENKADMLLRLEIVKACDYASRSNSSDHPDEFLYGRSGFLWACSFINKHIGDGTIPKTKMLAVADEIMKNGRVMAKEGGPPLMFEWYGERYCGAAHGLAGIMHGLMDVELAPDQVNDVKRTLYYMIKNRFLSGN
ncbi:unnamed protein product [Linum tenue]|uniref:Uncharacterized protein n=1 Tax=Linum tenue TaxID=586396 RepID=A0AAV0NQN9_9ROSI|nr:unnamed protein product [Linum tenue]